MYHTYLCTEPSVPHSDPRRKFAWSRLFGLLRYKEKANKETFMVQHARKRPIQCFGLAFSTQLPRDVKGGLLPVSWVHVWRTDGCLGDRASDGSSRQVGSAHACACPNNQDMGYIIIWSLDLERSGKRAASVFGLVGHFNLFIFIYPTCLFQCLWFGGDWDFLLSGQKMMSTSHLGADEKEDVLSDTLLRGRAGLN